MSRLPTPDGDDGVWGGILNDYLEVEHNADGTHRVSVTASKANDNAVVHNTSDETVAGVKTFSSSPVVPTPTTSTQAATKGYVDSTAMSGAPDATTSSKGIVELAGDLAGTAASPTVPGLGGKVDKSTVTTKGDLLAATASAALARLGVGSDGQILTADSTQTTGVKWAPSSALTVQDEGGSLTQRPTVNFVGAGVTATDDSANSRTLITIPGGSASTVDWINVTQAPYNADNTGAVDCSTAVQNAINAAVAGTNKKAVFFPAGTYKVVSSITINDGMVLIGEALSEKEFGKRVIWNSSSNDTFVFNGADAHDVIIKGICFSGNLTHNWLQNVDPATGFIAWDLTLMECGIHNFNNIVNGRFCRLNMVNNYFNNCATTLLSLYGSDAFVSNNYIDSNLAGTPTAAFLVNCQMTTIEFRSNYLTCCPNMALQIGRGHGSMFTNNIINGLSPRGAGADGCGIYISVADGVSLIGNYISLVVQNPFVQYTGAITVFDSTNINIIGTVFDNVPSGHVMYAIGQTTGTTSGIVISGTVYRLSTSKMTLAGTIGSITWDEWRGKYKTGAGARIADSDYPGTPPNGTTGVVYDSTSGNTLLAQRANGAWTHLVASGSGVSQTSYMVTPADQPTTSNTTYTDITGLALSVNAGEVWMLTGQVVYDGNNVGSLGKAKFQFTVPTSTTWYGTIDGLLNTTITDAGQILRLAVGSVPGVAGTQVGAAGVGLKTTILVTGWFQMTNTGTVKLQFAQANSDTVATTIYANSFLYATRLA